MYAWKILNVHVNTVTYVMEIPSGVLIRNLSQTPNAMSESMVFVPGLSIKEGCLIELVRDQDG